MKRHTAICLPNLMLLFLLIWALPVTAQDVSTFENEDFTLSYPSDWTLITDDPLVTAVIASTPDAWDTYLREGNLPGDASLMVIESGAEFEATWGVSGGDPVALMTAYSEANPDALLQGPANVDIGERTAQQVYMDFDILHTFFALEVNGQVYVFTFVGDAPNTALPILESIRGAGEAAVVEVSDDPTTVTLGIKLIDGPRVGYPGVWRGSVIGRNERIPIDYEIESGAFITATWYSESELVFGFNDYDPFTATAEQILEAHFRAFAPIRSPTSVTTEGGVTVGQDVDDEGMVRLLYIIDAGESGRAGLGVLVPQVHLEAWQPTIDAMVESVNNDAVLDEIYVYGVPDFEVMVSEAGTMTPETHEMVYVDFGQEQYSISSMDMDALAMSYWPPETITTGEFIIDNTSLQPGADLNQFSTAVPAELDGESILIVYGNNQSGTLNIVNDGFTISATFEVTVTPRNYLQGINLITVDENPGLPEVTISGSFENIRLEGE